MKRKIFISINLPDKVKKRLFLAMEKWHELPVKWVKEANLHVTLLFLGYIDDNTTAEICEKVRKVAEKMDIFDLDFSKIETNSASDPRLIWLTGEPSQALLELYESIEKELDIFKSAKKSFRPHITLGRIRKAKWQGLPEKPQINQEFSLNLSVESVDIMASDFKNSGQEYTLIEGCPLK
jgi:RNA 2',3'-cyclic 3'-phosphodiesterase